MFPAGIGCPIEIDVSIAVTATANTIFLTTRRARARLDMPGFQSLARARGIFIRMIVLGFKLLSVPHHFPSSLPLERVNSLYNNKHEIVVNFVMRFDIHLQAKRMCGHL